MKLRTLVADDSVVFRRVLSEALGSLPEVDLVGTASNGRQALEKIREWKPDLVTLDLEMPEIDGIGVLEALRQEPVPPAVIVVSAVSRRGGQLSLRALERGAFDFITKPETVDAERSREVILREIVPRVRALVHRIELRRRLQRPGPRMVTSTESRVRSSGGAGGGRAVGTVATGVMGGLAVGAVGALAGKLDGIADRMSQVSSRLRLEVVVIGVSTGGPAALARVLPGFPGDLGVPILVVQHMPAMFTQSLAENLAGKCEMEVREAESGEVLRPNTIYIAPGGRQMRVQPGGEVGKVVEVTDDPPENHCRPSVDYLFRSVASRYPGRSLAVILTGMGNDGALGCRLLKRQGCPVIAQDETTCVVYGMPRAVVEAKVVDWVLPLEAIAGKVVSLVRGGRS